MRMGIISYDFDPPIGGLGVVATQTASMLKALFPEDSIVVISSSANADEHVSPLATWRWNKRGGCPLFSFFLSFRLSSLIRLHKLDVIHAHAGSGGVFLLRKPACPFVVTSHHTYLQEADIVFRHSPVKRLWKRLMAVLEQRTYSLADRIVCVSRDTADFLVSRYAQDPKKISVIENAVVPTPVLPILKKDDATILFVGRLEERKGIDMLLHAYAILRTTHPHVRLRLVGSNLMSSRLDRLLNRLHLKDFVSLPGYVYDPLLQHEMLHATVLVVPSLLEGFGLIVVQGMLAGTCVVASDASGLRSIVKDQETGLLFHSGDSADCARVLVEALDHPELRSRLEKSAKADAVKRFSLEDRTRDLHGVFHELLSSIRSS